MDNGGKVVRHRVLKLIVFSNQNLIHTLSLAGSISDGAGIRARNQYMDWLIELSGGCDNVPEVAK